MIHFAVAPGIVIVSRYTMNWRRSFRFLRRSPFPMALHVAERMEAAGLIYHRTSCDNLALFITHASLSLFFGFADGSTRQMKKNNHLAPRRWTVAVGCVGCARVCAHLWYILPSQCLRDDRFLRFLGADNRTRARGQRDRYRRRRSNARALWDFCAFPREGNKKRNGEKYIVCMFGAGRAFITAKVQHSRRAASTSLRDITRAKREKLLARPFEI